MTISILLITLSLALFAYWFRYSCLLILRTKTAEDFASDVARANGLRFDAVRGQIEAGTVINGQELYDLLQRDYALLTQLLDRTEGAAKEQSMLEIQLLRMNFKISQVWFGISHRLGLRSSVSALEEMAETVSHFANSIGEWNAAAASA